MWNKCFLIRIMILLLLQCAMKAYLGITKHSKLQAKVAFLSKLYKVNLADGKNQDDLKRCGRINLLLTRLYFCVYFVTSVVLICSPIIIYLATNQVMPIMPVRLPFVQNDTVIGFICNAMFNIIMIFLAVCGNLGSEVFILTLWMHEWPMIRILKRAVTTLNQATRGIDHEAIRNSSWLKLHVRNIVLMHKDIYLWVLYINFVYTHIYISNAILHIQLCTRSVQIVLPGKLGGTIYKSIGHDITHLLHCEGIYIVIGKIRQKSVMWPQFFYAYTGYKLTHS